MTLYKWSQTASADASADSTINWAEGMSPAGVNDGGRAMMAAMAKFRDDIAGAIVTGGTSTAYTVLSYQQFDSLPHLDGKEIAFTPYTTNGATVTLSVDGLGDKPLQSAPAADLLAGVLVQGTPYVAVYNNADGAFYLRGFFGASPYLIPLGGMIDFIGTAAPNSFSRSCSVKRSRAPRMRRCLRWWALPMELATERPRSICRISAAASLRARMTWAASPRGRLVRLPPMPE